MRQLSQSSFLVLLSGTGTISFTWPPYADVEYATALPKPSETVTYARPYSELESLAGPQKTTIWASIASPTDSYDKFGNVAWSSRWFHFTVEPPPFTTTVTPTPIPSSQLVKPTPLPFSIGKGETDDFKFPEDFEWGFAGAALQVEGAVKTQGRGLSISEVILPVIQRRSDGAGPPDISVLNYFLYKEDIARLAALGVKSYSFSIAWPRILPFGYPGSPVNQEAIDHYDDLINTILEYGMEPIVTLHHFDTPLHYLNWQSWESWQGYAHSEFVDGFVNYSKIVLTHYSDRVGTWITFNEPNLDPVLLKNWKAGYHVVMAHARTVHFYRDEIKGSGKWGIKLALTSGFPLPLDPGNSDDIALTERQLDFLIGYMADPIYLGIQTPSSVIETLKSEAFIYTEEELQYVNGTADFFGVDIYTASYVTSLDEGTETCVGHRFHRHFPTCTNITSVRENWRIGAESNGSPSTWYQHARTIFKYLHTKYPTAGGILLAEYGWPTFHEASMNHDQALTEFTATFAFLSVLNEILKAIYEDGVKFKGALGWAYIDNWEWGQYNDRFGVQAFNNVTLERSYKRSIFDFVDFVRAHSET
ncbi:beta-glucosidase [Daldinia bambusicola]|nr:beta-glucosidase [Daldinia bambusicola]